MLGVDFFYEEEKNGGIGKFKIWVIGRKYFVFKYFTG